MDRRKTGVVIGFSNSIRRAPEASKSDTHAGQDGRFGVQNGWSVSPYTGSVESFASTDWDKFAAMLPAEISQYEGSTGTAEAARLELMAVLVAVLVAMLVVVALALPVAVSLVVVLVAAVGRLVRDPGGAAATGDARLV